MSRNLKKDYLKKLIGISTENGYKVDVANYVYNPSLEHEYPTMRKIISEDDQQIRFKVVEYFKYFDGTGEYLLKEYTAPKDANNTWFICKDKSEKVLEQSNRFNLNKLIQLAAAN